MADPVTHVNVWPADDELHVTWRGGGDVSVFVSTDPDDAGVDVRAPDGPGRAVIAQRETRVYVHLFDPGRGFTVAAERRVRLDGPDNFRDLGGYPTLDGATTRWGRVFRSDRLDGLSDADHDVLEALGVATVFDLRSELEAEHAPDRLPSGVAHVHMPMSSDTDRQRSIYQRLADGELTKYDHGDMADGYLRMLDAFGHHLAEIVRTVAEGRTVLFHCTAGKDRTGITAMVLLGLADVADPHVLDDYETTNRFRLAAHDGQTAAGESPFRRLIREKGLDPADFEILFEAPRPVMKRTVEGFRARWGDHRDYARAIGLDDDTVESARRVLRREAD